MAVLAHSIVENITGIYGFVAQLGIFALAQSWTKNEENSNVNWQVISTGPTVYGFDTGPPNESFLNLSSSGIGALQTLRFRFRAEDANSTTNHEWLRFGAFVQASTGNDTAVATNPVFRNGDGDANTNTKSAISFPTDTITKIWFFGFSNHYIEAVIQTSPDSVTFVSFGSLDLFNAAETQGNWWGCGTPSASSTFFHFNKATTTPWDSLTSNFYVEDEQKGSTEQGQNFYTANQTSFIKNKFHSYHAAVIENTHSTVRAMFKQLWYYRRNADSLWVPFGQSWPVRLDHRDLAIGEEFFVGGDKYIGFPCCDNDTDHAGIAYRVL